MMMISGRGNEVACSAKNLKREWRRCYMSALGLPACDFEDDADCIPKQSRDCDAKRSRITIVNLTTSDAPAAGSKKPSARDAATVDPWNETAQQVQNNILEMANWIQKKKWDFVSVNMPDDEASLIGSTVTSFIPTTANEIESLRQLARSIPNATMQQHYMGIVQILMMLLKEHVNDPFSLLQKQRSRVAVALWQNPLQCQLAIRNSSVQDDHEEDELDATLGISSPLSIEERLKKQLFEPHRQAHLLQQNFMEPYAKSRTLRKERPDSALFARRFARKLTDETAKGSRESPMALTTMPTEQRIPPPADDFYMSQETLQQESLLLAVHHDLDSVQQMEQRMVDITTLLSQFSSLVSEQQEYVQVIYEVTSDAKSNIEQGQEELLKAKETVKASKHYTAKLITTMGILLLVLHWVVP